MDLYSNKCFTKLNNQFDIEEIFTEVGTLTFHESYQQKINKYVIALGDYSYKPTRNNTYDLIPKDRKKVVSQLPKSLTDLEVPEIGIMEFLPPANADRVMIAPHRDLVRLCCINIYLKTQGGKTTFYNYKAGKIEEIEGFTAKDGDTYILNVDVPHSVEMTSGITRNILTMSFMKTPYSEVIKHVK